jgi:hypothetical protein
MDLPAVFRVKLVVFHIGKFLSCREFYKFLSTCKYLLRWRPPPSREVQMCVFLNMVVDAAEAGDVSHLNRLHLSGSTFPELFKLDSHTLDMIVGTINRLGKCWARHHPRKSTFILMNGTRFRYGDDLQYLCDNRAETINLNQIQPYTVRVKKRSYTWVPMVVVVAAVFWYRCRR